MADFLFTSPQGISSILLEPFHQIFYKQNICTRFLELKNYHPIGIYNLLLFLHYMFLYIHLLIDYQIEHLFLFTIFLIYNPSSSCDFWIGICISKTKKPHSSIFIKLNTSFYIFSYIS